MKFTTTIRLDGIAAGEHFALVRHRLHRPDPSAVPAIYCHHATGGHYNGYKGWTRSKGTVTDRSIMALIELLATRGHPVIANTQAGATSWSTATAIQRVTDALAAVAAETGCRSDRVLIFGDSMGSLLGLNWIRRNPQKVAAGAFLLPIPDLKYARENTQVGAGIEAAYGGAAGYEAALPTHNPAAMPEAFAGVPLAFWHSSNDPTAVASVVDKFGVAVGAEVRSMGAVDHTIPASFDVADVADFLTRHA